MKLTLKSARVNAGLTQAAAGKALGVSGVTLSSWERGKTFPDAVQIKKIEKLYGVSYNDIIFLPQITL